MLPAVEKLDLTVPESFNLTGANLSMMSQLCLYQGIISLSLPKPRMSTFMQLDITRYAIEHMSGYVPSDKQI